MRVILDLILAGVGVEAFILALLSRKAGRNRAFHGALANVASGFCLLLAVRLALEGVPDGAVLGLVTLAGAAHAADMLGRFR